MTMQQTTLDARSQEWQGTGGPPEWVNAWTRTRELIGERLTYFAEHDTDGSTADSVCGLATALYIVARDRGIDARTVPREAVEDLLRPRTGETWPDIVLRWEADLERLGHNIDDPSDPVSARWRILRIDHDPDEDYWDDVLHRHGPGLLDGGLTYALGPTVALPW